MTDREREAFIDRELYAIVYLVENQLGRKLPKDERRQMNTLVRGLPSFREHVDAFLQQLD